MMLPWVSREVGKTGRRRYRLGWFGRVIMQVEVNVRVYHLSGRSERNLTTWRDAKPEDVGLPTVCLSPPTFLRVHPTQGVLEVDDEVIQDNPYPVKHQKENK